MKNPSTPYLFSSSSYDTGESRRDWLSKLTFNSRINFFLRVCKNFYLIGKCSKKGAFNRENQIYYSEKNIDILERCGAQIHLRGLEHLKGDGPFVIAGNHMSAVETIMLNAVISPRQDFTYVIKNSLFKVPFMRQAMRAVDAIGVDQVNPRDDFKVILEEGRKRLSSGRSVVIFPEAARCSEFKPERFNSIAVKLAKSANVPIIPFALKTDFLGLGGVFVDFGAIHPHKHIHIEFAAPRQVTGNGRQTNEEIIRFIMNCQEKWERLQSDLSSDQSGVLPERELGKCLQ